MNPLDHAYDKAKESWSSKINSLYMDVEPENLEAILQTIKEDQHAFQQLSKYRDFFLTPDRVDSPQPEPASVKETVEKPIIPSFKVNRKLRGAEARLIGNESITYYIPEYTCLMKDLHTGTIIRGTTKGNRLMVHDVTLRTSAQSDPSRHVYENCLVLIDKGGQMYTNRYQDNTFIKDEQENFIRLNISNHDKEHFDLEENDIVHVAEDRKTGSRIISFKVKKEDAKPVVNKDAKKNPEPVKTVAVKTPAEKREALFRSLPATPEVVLTRSVTVFAPERVHQRFIDTLEILCGMRVRMVGEESKESQIISCIQESEFFIIASGNTDGSLYKRLRAACNDAGTQFRTLVHSGVSETLRNIVEMIVEEETFSI